MSNFLAPAAAGIVLVCLTLFLFRPVTAEELERNFHVPSGKRIFHPTDEWQKVEKDHICPAGLEFRMDLSTGESFAKLRA